MARDRNDNPHTWDWKSPDNHDLAYERGRLQTIQVPPKPRGPVHTTAAYLVAYLRTFPTEFHTLLSAASTGDRSTLPVVPIMYGAIARKVNKHGMAETRQSFLLLS